MSRQARRSSAGEAREALARVALGRARLVWRAAWQALRAAHARSPVSVIAREIASGVVATASQRLRPPALRADRDIDREDVRQEPSPGLS